MKELVCALWAVALLVFCVPPAGALNIAYINSEGGSIDYLASFGHTVTYLPDPVGMTGGSLSEYDAVVVASNSLFPEPAELGDALADFADSGRGVVLTEFVFQGGWSLAGRIMTAAYSPFTADPSSEGYDFTSRLGTLHAPGNLLLSGISIDASTDYQAEVGVNGAAVLVADWESGRHALAYTPLGGSSVVGLNLFPGQSTLDYYSQLLLANAIEFSVNDSPVDPPAPGPVPEPATLVLLGAGLLGVAMIGTRMKK